MSILNERRSWKRPRAHDDKREAVLLTPDQQQAVRRAIRALAARHGSLAALARVIGCSRTTVAHAVTTHAPTIGTALRIARAAKAPLDDVLSGTWPAAGSCPHCGRS